MTQDMTEIDRLRKQVRDLRLALAGVMDDAEDANPEVGDSPVWKFADRVFDQTGIDGDEPTK